MGGLCLLIAFLSMKVIPVNIGAILLLVVGVAMLVVEGYVTTHGLAGALGAVAIVVGTLLFIDKSSPEYRFDPEGLTLSPLVVWPTPIALAALLGFVGWKVARTRREKLVVGAAGMVGEVGEVTSEVGPDGGEVFVHGELWAARSPVRVPRGEPVKVREVRGLVLEVEPRPRPQGVLP